LTVTWKQVAWNGVCFPVPASWEVVQIGRRYLQFENDAGPSMEIKWGHVSGNFSHQSHLKRIQARHRRRSMDPIQSWAPPSRWQKVLSEFTLSGFTWQDTYQQAQGLILFCPSCRTATLIQFFQRLPGEAAVELLSNFRDHPQGDDILWCMYDIGAKIPREFQLSRHRFDAGRFELGFSKGRQCIFLYRWGLASVIMAEQGLEQLARGVADFGNRWPQSVAVDGMRALQWEVSAPSAWRSWLRAGPVFRWLRLWYLEEKDRILGVSAEGRRAFDSRLLDQICTDYESL
jgi:hypothetical protein